MSCVRLFETCALIQQNCFLAMCALIDWLVHAYLSHICKIRLLVGCTLISCCVSAFLSQDYGKPKCIFLVVISCGKHLRYAKTRTCIIIITFSAIEQFWTPAFGQEMVWRWQAPKHILNQCWIRSFHKYAALWAKSSIDNWCCHQQLLEIFFSFFS